MPLTLGLLTQAVGGVTAIAIWLYHYVMFAEKLESNGAPIWSMRLYEVSAPIVVAALGHIYVGNLWFTLGLASPLWLIWVFDGLEAVARRTWGKRGLGDTIWLWAMCVPVFVLVAYILLPMRGGDNTHLFNNVEGVGYGAAAGTIVGILTMLGAGGGWVACTRYRRAGGIVGGVISWVILSVLLTLEFDSLLVRMAISYVTTPRLYVVGFLLACSISAFITGMVEWIVHEWIEGK